MGSGKELGSVLEGPWSWDARSSPLALLAGVEEQGCGEGCQGGEAGRVGGQRTRGRWLSELPSEQR